MSDNVKTWPERIWLQVGRNHPDDDTEQTYSREECEEMEIYRPNMREECVNKGDVEYIRKDVAEAMIKKAREEERTTCLAIVASHLG